ncbi:MAG: phosphotransferase [Minwuiales bacterium]|nr:phosphotransferase [Minwuiales bacterium]
MTEEWERRSPVVRLDGASVSRLLRPVFGDRRIVAVSHADGGKANTNYRVTVQSIADPVQVRLFTREPKAATIETALLRLVAGAVPVPTLLHVADDNPVTGHPYAVMTWMPGLHLTDGLDAAAPGDLRALGAAVGRVLADIGQFRFDKAGFFDGNLSIAQELDIGAQGFRTLMHNWLFGGLAGERLGAGPRDAFWRFLDGSADILNGWTAPPCLVHSDFGGSNILIRKDGERWTVSAVLDWEFAFSGSPLVDLGHLLRRPGGDMPAFEAGLIDGYRENGGDLPSGWKPMARLLDLTAWVDFLNQPGDRPNLHEAARRTIVKTMQEWPNLA